LSVITKVLVVLVMVLAVAAVSLVVPYVANTENLKEKNGDLARQIESNRATEAGLRDQVTQAGMRIAKMADEQAAALKAKDDEADGVRRHADDLQQGNQRLTTENAQYKGDAARWVVSQKALTDMMASTLKELDACRELNAKSSAEVARASQSEAEQRDARAAMERQFNQAHQEVVRLNDKVAEMESWWEQVPQADRDRIAHGVKGPAESTTPLYGHVDAIAPADGKQMIQIDIGKNDGVQPNMVFRIFRSSDHNPKFLGRLVIVRVDDRQAAGVVELEQAAIAKGDMVESGGL